MVKISVILPVYNCEKFIVETIESVLQQTFTDFEFLIIDDCSTDNTVALVEQFKDDRIQLIKKEKNSGYTDSLNYAVSLAKGEYIARMDGDDICLPTRFEKQIAFLQKNPDVILCGTAIQFIGLDNNIKLYPLKHDSIKIKICFGTPFCHPSVMGKKQVFLEVPYDRKFEPAEDIHLWSRIVKIGKVENLDEVLLLYRTHANQISISKKEIQDKNSFSIRMEYLKKFSLTEEFSEEELRIVFKNDKIQNFEECKIMINLFKYLKIQNHKINEFDVKEFDNVVDSIKIQKLKLFFTLKSFLSLDSLFFFIIHATPFDAFKVLNLRKKIKRIF